MCAGLNPDDDPEGEGLRKEYRRGLAPFVFLPWEAVLTSPLNLAIKDMDYFLAG